MSERAAVATGSVNVFADLGLEDAEELFLKADLALAITRLIRQRGLTHLEAGKLMGLAQPDVSEIECGRLDDFSIGRLLAGVTALDQDVTITIWPTKQER